MSRVTTLIILTGNSEDENYLKKAFHDFRVGNNPFNLVSVDDEILPKGWYGGTKLISNKIFIGGYNYLELNELIEFMKQKITWHDENRVQLVVREQDDDKFRIIDIF